MPTFGEIVKHRREELQLTQQELAEKLGYSSSTTISRIENGSRDGPQKQVAKIAQALDMDPASLITLQIESVPKQESIEEAKMRRLYAYYKALTEVQQKSIIEQMEYMDWKNKEEEGGGK